MMNTIILDARLDANIALCAETIRSGGLVGMPTETVYGLGANALDADAAAGIFAAKGRPADNPLIVHVASPEDVGPLVSELPDVFDTLTSAFWPGPLTLVMRKSGLVPDIVTGGLDTVAVRLPAHPAALALIRACGLPIAAPSANPSGRPSPTKAEHVKNDLDGRIPYILDGGGCRVGLESTVLDISGEVPRVLRPGGVTLEQLRAVLPCVEAGGEGESSGEDEAPRSPGMKYRHYAPDAPVTALIGPPETTAEYIRRHMREGEGALMFDDFAFDRPGVVTFGASGDPAAQAARLFGALRELDAMRPSVIYAQAPPEEGLGRAVANRIVKAAGGNVAGAYTGKSPNRKHIRLKDFDYSNAGCYFITICIEDRRELLGKIAGDDAHIVPPFLRPSVGDAALGVPRVKLTPTGEMVKKHVEHINKLSAHIHLDHYVIMPDHIHLLVSIEIGTPRAASPTKAAIPQLVNALKSLTSKKFGETLWQRSYHDRVIRNHAEYLEIWRYIDQNAAKWAEDEYYG